MSPNQDQDAQDTQAFIFEMTGGRPESEEPSAQAAAASEPDESDAATSDQADQVNQVDQFDQVNRASAMGLNYDEPLTQDSDASASNSDADADANADAAASEVPPIPSVVAESEAQSSDQDSAQSSEQDSEPSSEQSMLNQGIPSVTGGGDVSSDNKKKGLFLLLIALLLLIVGIVVYLKFFKEAAVEDTAAATSSPSASSLTSTRQLADVELPVSPPEPEIEEPAAPVPAEIPAPVLMPPPAATAGNVDANGDPLPTLEELKFAAPMMGAVQSGGSSGGSYGANAAGAPYGAPGSSGDYAATASGYPGAGALGGANLGAMPAGQGGSGALASQLNAVATPSSAARVIKQQSLTLSKGTVIECILETRVDTTVPGMTSCVIPRDIYSMNGRVLLIERGTKAIGEYQGSVQNGLARIFMLWTELRTPNGVSIQLNSPVADALGGAGMGGYVDFHWFKRFGNALLFSLISDGFQYIVNSANENNNNGDVTYENTQDGMDEIIKEAMAQSGNIPPTLIKNQGERVSIFVARDLNFSQVYGIARGQNSSPAGLTLY